MLSFKFIYIRFIYDSLYRFSLIGFLWVLFFLLIKSENGVTCGIHPRKMLKLAHPLKFEQYPDCLSITKIWVFHSKKAEKPSICPEETFLFFKRMCFCLYFIFFHSFLNTFRDEHEKCIKLTFPLKFLILSFIHLKVTFVCR